MPLGIGRMIKRVNVLTAWALSLCFLGCESTYYSAMESMGIEKRDLLVNRVEEARDSQEQAQAQFASALEQYSTLINFNGGELASIYTSLSDDYEDSSQAAANVSRRINAIEDVADDLFAEWSEELEQYSNTSLKRDSATKLRDTQRRYKELLRAMRRVEDRMEPVLNALKDNVLYLKHNLNAKAIGALQGELEGITSDVSRLITDMNTAIAESNAFIISLK